MYLDYGISLTKHILCFIGKKYTTRAATCIHILKSQKCVHQTTQIFTICTIVFHKSVPLSFITFHVGAQEVLNKADDFNNLTLRCIY